MSLAYALHDNDLRTKGDGQLEVSTRVLRKCSETLWQAWRRCASSVTANEQ